MNAPLLSMLARDTKGLLMVHHAFGLALGPSLKANWGRCFGSSAVLDCFVSDGLRLVQWLGPVEVLQARNGSVRAFNAPSTLRATILVLLQSPEPEDIGLSMAQDRRLSGGACSVPRLQEGQGAALRLELTRDLECPEVFLQVSMCFVFVHVIFKRERDLLF